MEYTAQFTYDCLWRVDGEKRVCTGGHESDGYPWFRNTFFLAHLYFSLTISSYCFKFVFMDVRNKRGYICITVHNVQPKFNTFTKVITVQRLLHILLIVSIEHALKICSP